MRFSAYLMLILFVPRPLYGFTFRSGTVRAGSLRASSNIAYTRVRSDPVLTSYRSSNTRIGTASRSSTSSRRTTITQGGTSIVSNLKYVGKVLGVMYLMDFITDKNNALRVLMEKLQAWLLKKVDSATSDDVATSSSSGQPLPTQLPLYVKALFPIKLVGNQQIILLHDEDYTPKKVFDKIRAVFGNPEMNKLCIQLQDTTYVIPEDTDGLTALMMSKPANNAGLEIYQCP